MSTSTKIIAQMIADKNWRAAPITKSAKMYEPYNPRVIKAVNNNAIRLARQKNVSRLSGEFLSFLINQVGEVTTLSSEDQVVALLNIRFKTRKLFLNKHYMFPPLTQNVHKRSNSVVEEDNYSANLKAEAMFFCLLNNYDGERGSTFDRGDKKNVLDSNQDYIDHYLKPKVYKGNFKELCRSVIKKNGDNYKVKLADLNKMANVEFYGDEENKGLYVAYVMEPNESDLYGELFRGEPNAGAGVSISYVPTSEVEDVAISKSVKTIALNTVQLCRYDRSSPFDHPNEFNVKYESKMVGSNVQGQISEMARKVFETRAPTPHFHFCSRDSANHFDSVTKANAMSIPRLERYIEELKNPRDDKILKTAFGMPFLEIRNHPKKYRLCVDDLKNVFEHHKNNDEIMAELKNTVLSMNEDGVLYGLDAVLADLRLIEKLNRNSQKNKDAISDELEIAKRVCSGGTIIKSLEAENKKDLSAKDNRECEEEERTL